MQIVSVDKEELRVLVADALELPVQEVTDDAAFIDDLGVDSLAALEIAVRLEGKYGMKIENFELTTTSSLDWLHRLLTG
jgi:acyl carrier protein